MFIKIVELTEKAKLKAKEGIVKEDHVGPHHFIPSSRLGKGSFGEVYLVTKRDTDEQFAMKILHKKKIMG